MAVSPDVVSVIVVDAVSAVFVTVPEPATVNESEIAVPVIASLNVKSIVFNADLIAVNVGVTPIVT